MKKLLFLSISFLLVSFISGLFAQTASFQTGKIGVEINQFGRVRIHAPAIGATRQIDRSSILAGVGRTEVFDYRNDANMVVAPFTVTNPTKSDFEIFSVIDNSYNNLPPKFEVRINAFGWHNEGFIVVKFTVINRETTVKNTRIGIEIIPQPDGTYGNETIKFDPTNMIAQSFRDTGVRTGYKILNTTASGFRVIDWFSTYFVGDSLLWDALNYNNFDLTYTGTGDGTVTFLSQPPVSISPNDSAHFFIGIAVANTESELIANMNLAQQKYNLLVNVEDNLVPLAYSLSQNYPNPFNPMTKIQFSLPKKEKVTIDVFNVFGEFIARVVDNEYEAGIYTLEFDGKNLSSGTYFYQLVAGEFKSTRKMILIK